MPTHGGNRGSREPATQGNEFTHDWASAQGSRYTFLESLVDLHDYQTPPSQWIGPTCMSARNRLWSWTAEVLSLEEAQPRELLDLLHYWQSKCANDVPDQRDLHIAGMGEATGNIALLNLRTNPFRARYRLVGRNLVDLLGKDPTEKYIHEVYGVSISAEIYEGFEKAVKERAAVYFRREFQILGKSFGYNRLVLPLTFKSDEISRLLVCIYPMSKSLKKARQWQSVVRELREIEESERKLETSWLSSQQDSAS